MKTCVVCKKLKKNIHNNKKKKHENFICLFKLKVINISALSCIAKIQFFWQNFPFIKNKFESLKLDIQ